MPLYVMNGSKEPLAERHNGVDFVFHPGKTVEITPAAAQHIFGYGEDSKKRALIRLGWIQKSTDEPEAMERLGKFVFEEYDKPEPPDLSVSRGKRRAAQVALPQETPPVNG